MPCILILSKFLYSPTDAQVNRLKNNFKIYIKIYIKTAPTCFGAVTPSSGSALFDLAKVTVVKIASYLAILRTNNALPDSVQQLHVRQPSTYAKPEAACAVLGS